MKTLVCHLTVILMLFASLASAQDTPAMDLNTYLYSGAGSRGLAMGGAYIGLANDVSGGSWNPAGIYQIDKLVVSASYNVYKPGGEFTNSFPLFSIDNTDNNDINVNALSHGSVVVPARIKGHPWVFSFNYIRNNQRSENRAYKGNVASGLDVDTYVEDLSHMKTYNFGMSTRLYGHLAFGFLANVYDGRRVVDVKTQMVYDSLIYPNYGIGVDLFTEDREIDSITTTGFNMTLGLLYNLDKFNFGVVFKNGFTLKHSADVTYPREKTINGLVDVTDSQVIITDDILFKQDMPTFLGFGVGVEAIENLTLGFELDYHNYGSVSYYGLDSMKFTPDGEKHEFYNEVPIDWNNTVGFAVGAEYLLNTSIGEIPLRGGFRFDQLPKSDKIDVTYNYEEDRLGNVFLASTDVLASGRQNTTTFSLGTGIHWSQLYLEFMYRYTTGSKYDVDYTFNFLDELIIDANQSFEHTSHDFGFSFTGYF